MKKYELYLPEFMREFREINEISKPENKVIYDEWKRFSNVEKTQWLKTADSDGLKRYEDMFDISGGGNSDDVRRAALLVKYNNNFIYTYYSFQTYLDTVCGGSDDYDFEVIYDEYTVNISLGLKKKFLYNTIKDYARYIIPANMTLNVKLKYNKHQNYINVTHRYMSKYSHFDLRNAVME